jgi:hypothetical protein
VITETQTSATGTFASFFRSAAGVPGFPIKFFSGRLVVVVIAVAVAPVPVLLLPFGWELAEVDVIVVVVFADPLAVIDRFAVVPDVVVAVVGVIDPVVVVCAGRAQNR